MKQFTCTLALFFCFCISKANILRCNNNPNVTGCYATAQAAHDAANSGDTIHLEPSINPDYGYVQVTKKITLISTGDFTNVNPNNQVPFLNSGYCNSLTLQGGADYSVISATITGDINIYSDNITVTHSHCNNINLITNSGDSLSNILISKNAIDQTINSASWNSFCSNIIITNNFMRTLFLSANTSAVITYNSILFGNYYTPSTIWNSIFSHNIYSSPYSITFTNCNISDNICSNQFLPIGNNNENDVDMSTVFLNWNTWSGDHFELNPSYPNQDLGMFAGVDPYTLACQPGIPSIYQLSIPATATGNTLNITVSTKSHQ